MGTRAGAAGDPAGNMEIAFSRKGELRILSLKGNLRLQQWRVIDKHLEALLASGARWVALDLSGAALVASEGVACLRRSLERFRERGANLLLVSDTAPLREAFRPPTGGAGGEDVLFADWPGLEARLQGAGAARPGP